MATKKRTVRKRNTQRSKKRGGHSTWVTVAWLLVGGALAVGAFAALFVLVVKPLLWSSSEDVRLSDYNVRGIDISHYQPHVDWDQLCEARLNDFPIRFVIIKSTEGVSFRDKLFRKHSQSARSHGFVVGAYHFFSPTEDGDSQAQHYLRNTTLQPGDFPPVLDVETRGKKPLAEFQEEVLSWLRVVEQAYGVKPIIYSGVSFKKKYLRGERFDAYPFWAAHYNKRSAPRYNGQWVMWQYSDQGRVQGVDQLVDLNVFHGTMDDLRALLIPGE